ncbi:MAG TPA: DNA translocase FtsK [Clostridiaceae bacterium]|nr:DNA translocase FtsK [Clostridiaceae bacterium]
MALSIYFSNITGPLGDLLARIAGGLFGMTAYALPPLILIHGIIKIFKPQLLHQDRRFYLVIALLVVFSSMLQAGLYDVSRYENLTLPRYIDTFYKEGLSAIGKRGEFISSGGVLGGIIGVPLLFVFKKLGTMIVLTTAAIILALLITRLSLYDAARSVAKGTSEAISSMVDAARKKREERLIRKSLEELVIREDSPADAAVPGRRKGRVLDFPLEDQGNTEKGPDLPLVKNDQPAAPVSAGSRVKEESKLRVFDLEPGEPERKKKQDHAPKTAPEPREKESTETPKPEENEEEKLQADLAPSGEMDFDYVYPPYELLLRSKEGESNMRKLKSSSVDNAKKLEATLESFGIGARVINISVGPAFTRYELQPAPGIKVSRIVNLTDDIALNLAATGVRIEAPIPGKAAIGIEVPNKEVAPISLRSVLESDEFKNHRSHLAVALGKDISGENVVIDLSRMPHLLIAGATGSGKSVCLNSIIISLLYKSSPEDVKMLMIDPKVVELGVYNGIPHLLIPVVTDPNKAAGALRWAVSEMTARYKLFADRGVRDLLGYNATVEETGEGAKLPQIVIIIDELADLMMVAPHDVEDSICRLAQMARAAGMYLVIATQRPSVNVITGVIKANIPSRIAFAVSSQVDSRTILDMAGAEKLLGKGDMLYYPVGIPKPIRVKGAYVSDKEVEMVVDFVKNQANARYDQEIIENINDNAKNNDDDTSDSDRDELLDQAIEAVIECGQASVSFIQRRFKVGYARAGRIIDQMAERNIISGYEGSKPRRVLITKERWEEMKMSSGDKA